MRIVEELPQKVETIEHVSIPMRDGCRLSARIWLPEEARAKQVPAILEYIPYRTRDLKRDRDTQMHAYFAAHGYACVRVDLRGSGNSEGVLKDEYLPQELDDGVEVLEWIAEQPWCSGQVGMIGISWGGFNGLQIAARRPPQLGAVISVSFTDDRYADDVHYMGGCLLTDNLSWASTMFAFNSLPPDPAVVGERWRDMWFERLEHSGLWLETWLRHQHRDDYWRHGSVCEDYAAIQCPVMAVSGWADGYSNAVFRLVEGLKVPKQGLIGPWSHAYPHLGRPGPGIGFLQEALRWWDQWLKAEETGIMDEPMLRVWMQDSIKPSPIYERRPGRWVAEQSWPSPNIRQVRYPLGRRHILPAGAEAPQENEEPPLSVQSPLSVGLFAGKWCSYATGPDLPHDQREEDGGSLVFDSEPLTAPMEILGAPVVELELEANKPVGMIAVRLSDVAPDDKATRVSYGLLNLCHRNGHENPEPLEPGKRERVRLTLNDAAQHFPAGHRLRLAISTSYWPLAWPPPEPVRLAIHPSRSGLTMPVRVIDRRYDSDVVEFEPAEGAPRLRTTRLKPQRQNWLINRDLATDVSALHVINDEGTVRIDEIDLTVTKDTEEWYRIFDDDFTSASGEVRSVRALKRGDWSAKTVTRTVLSCSDKAFVIHATLDAYESGNRVFSKIWNRMVPRELV